MAADKLKAKRTHILRRFLLTENSNNIIVVIKYDMGSK